LAFSENDEETKNYYYKLSWSLR